MTTLRGPGRPESGYKLADGTRVPGVTTITGRYKRSEGLVHWAWDCGMKGLDYRKVRDDAAAAGTLGHEMIDARIHDVPPAVPVDATEEQIAQAKVALRAFDRWSQSVGMKILVTELPLVSERHRFGGTLDGLGRVADGALAILDFKTGKVFPEHILQLAAYAELVGECRGETVEEAYLLRVSRESGNFSYHQYDRATLDTGIEAFLLMRKLYDYDSKLKKAC